MNTSTLDGLAEAYARISAINQRALGQLAQVAVAFRQRGIAFLLLKGGDLVTRLYGVRGLRPIADLDLLVRPDDLPTTHELLTGMGYDQRIDGNPAYHREGGLTLDLVTSLWYLDDDALAGVWARASRRQIGGQHVAVLGSDDLLIHLTAYAVVHRGALSPGLANDLALLTQKEQLDWPGILAEAKARHLTVPLHHGLSYARSRQGLCLIPDPVLRALAPSSPRERFLAALLRRLVTEQYAYGVGFLLLFLTTPGRRKWRWLLRTLWPTKAFLGYRYGARGAARPALTRLARVPALLLNGLRLGRHVLRRLGGRRTPSRS